MNQISWKTALLCSIFVSVLSMAQTSLPDLAKPLPQATTQATQPQPVSGQPDAELRIGNGDLLTVAVYGAPDFNNDVRVSSTGDISLPLIGIVHVAGLSTTEAQALIKKKLTAGGFFSDPQVSVFAKEYSTQGVSVLGEVQKPGVYPLLGSRTLFDAISTASGVTERAGNTVTITHRDQPNAPQTVEFHRSSNVGNVPIYPGDTIVVSRAGMVYVVGDVHTPSGIILDKKDMTVLQALAMAQGTNPTAALGSARLIRTQNDNRHEIPLNLKRILAAKSPDMRLQENDIIFVPTSTGKRAAATTLDAIVRVTTGVAYRRF